MELNPSTGIIYFSKKEQSKVCLPCVGHLPTKMTAEDGLRLADLCILFAESVRRRNYLAKEIAKSDILVAAEAIDPYGLEGLPSLQEANYLHEFGNQLGDLCLKT